jgi:hypothetical protein
MSLKGYRLWVMGQLDSTCSAPPSPQTDAARAPCCSARAEGGTHSRVSLDWGYMLAVID